MDIALTYDADLMAFDLCIGGPAASPDLEGDSGLLTAVIISLFTDARAHADDPLPDERVGQASDRRGFWGDGLHDPSSAFQAPASIGSRLWLLWREKDLDEVVARADMYAREALSWLEDEGWVKSLAVSAERVQKAYLGISVSLLPAGGEAPGREWRFLYDYTRARLVKIF